jgi:Pyridoxamine-phosphate oxidase
LRQRYHIKSSRISGRDALEDRFEQLLQEQEGSSSFQCPDYWGGYRLVPEYFEFWQGRECRLHDRICYEKNEEGWDIFRKSP